MAKTTTSPFTQTVKNISYIILPTQTAHTINTTTGVLTVGGTDSQLIYTAGAEGSVIKSLCLASTDTAAKHVGLWLGQGAAGPIALIGVVAVPLTSGYSATGVVANVNVLGNTYIVGLSYDQMGVPVLQLEPLSRLYVGLVAALTAQKFIYVTGSVEDF